MIQDIHPHRFDIAFKRRDPEDGDYAIVWNGEQMLLGDEGGPHCFPTCSALMEAVPGAASRLNYLFSLDDKSFYLVSEPVSGIDGYAYRNTQVFRTFKPSWLAFAGVTAGHLAAWYAQNRFCGGCGARTAGKTDERSLSCAACGLTVYPRISPAVIVAVADGSRLLLTRYADRPNVRMALVAGFMEVGETMEDTVRREVMEEVGVMVKNIRYYKSQPWAFSGSVLAGFFADLHGAPDLVIDAKELREAVWMERGDIPPNESTISLTSEMIDKFRLGDFPA